MQCIGGERDTIRYVQIRAGAIYVYGCMYVCHKCMPCIGTLWAELSQPFLFRENVYNVGGVTCQPFKKHSNHWTGTKND